MLSKNTTLFLAIAAFYEAGLRMLNEVQYLVNTEYYRDSFASFAWLGVLLITPVALALTCIFLYNGKVRPRKISAIVLAAISGISIALQVYANVTYWDKPHSRYEEFSGVVHFSRYVLPLLPMVATLLFGIALAGDHVKRIRRSAMWLIAGSLTSLLSTFFNDLFGLYYLGEMLRAAPALLQLQQILSYFLIALPLATLIVGFSILKRTAPAVEETPGALAAPTVTRWLQTYLLSALPVAGFVLLIFWIADHKDRVQRNWALATFLARIVSTAALFFLYLPPLLERIGFPVEDSDYYMIGICSVLALLIGGGILLFSYYNNKPYDEETGDGNPSVWGWVANFLILAIPLIGLVMLIVWATDNRNRIIRNWAVARIIWIGISLLILLNVYVLAVQYMRIQPFVYFQF